MKLLATSALLAFLFGPVAPHGSATLVGQELENGVFHYSLIEAGLGRFVRLDKPEDFPGKAALAAEKRRGVTKRFVTLVVDAGATVALATNCNPCI